MSVPGTTRMAPALADMEVSTWRIVRAQSMDAIRGTTARGSVNATIHSGVGADSLAQQAKEGHLAPAAP